jgi:hypothetical protein
MMADAAAKANLGASLDHGESPDRHSFRQLRGGIDKSGGMNVPI